MTGNARHYASSPCMTHEAWPKAETKPRLVPDRPLPAYAYLPGGRFPHPVRDPDGHSFGEATPPMPDASPDSEDFRFGVDLFNHGYYWEAHEAWEPLWRATPNGDARRALLKGLILMAAAGIKVREGKTVACAKHAGRAAVLFRSVALRAPGPDTTAACLASHADALAKDPPRRQSCGEPESVFDFVLGPSSL